MLIYLKVNNCFIYENEIEFSMRGDMRNKRFGYNIITNKNTNVLKSAIIVGPNNSGKTNLIKCFKGLKAVMLNKRSFLDFNLFSNNTVCKMEVSFVCDGNEYVFSFKYDAYHKNYIYECFSEIEYDKHGNKKETEILKRDIENSIFKCDDDQLLLAMKAAAKNNILIYLLDTTQFKILDEIKDKIVSFAEKIEIVDMNNIPDKKTLEMLKANNNQKEKIVDFILNADLCLDNIKYVSDDELVLKTINPDNMKAQEEIQNIPSMLVERLHLVSTYKGVNVPSLFFDSTGTKKITAISSYVIEALEKGKILIVDELDNSLHFKLTRAIISLFNNELNSCAQLICTVHDITLIDCKKLFRKEQIWFAHKDRDEAYLYSLSEFTYNKDSVRADTDDLFEKYKKGIFGALPEPDLFKSLLEVQNNE